MTSGHHGSRFQLPEEVIQRCMARRGRVRFFEHFDPERTALLVIDMQRYYFPIIPAANDIIAPINRLSGQLRKLGGTVIWVRMTTGDGERSLWPLYHTSFLSEEMAASHRGALQPGDPGHEIWPSLDVAPEDLIVDKNRYSALVDGSSNLRQVLDERNLENVIICGMATNACCETTARDAMMLDYRVTIVADANAAVTTEVHYAALVAIAENFGNVMDVDEVLDNLLAPASK